MPPEMPIGMSFILLPQPEWLDDLYLRENKGEEVGMLQKLYDTE